ncbi:unnamed protein product [Angiostrongylus costaricensis]|uniref:Uncharacterized protein n=1 Tax=Angiostrongylus costaricensis TaxID=334426 RepID=A0A0R3PCD6_ANGCS|nr:unnamed protein product [Angiostrongylus costaricensis]
MRAEKKMRMGTVSKDSRQQHVSSMETRSSRRKKVAAGHGSLSTACLMRRSTIF